MENLAMDDGWSYCRVCFDVHKSCSPIKWETYLMEKFIFVSSLKIDPADELPKSLCDSCTQLTEEFHKFKLKCAESDSKFRAITVEPAVAPHADSLDRNVCGDMTISKVECMIENVGEAMSFEEDAKDIMDMNDDIQEENHSAVTNNARATLSSLRTKVKRLPTKSSVRIVSKKSTEQQTEPINERKKRKKILVCKHCDETFDGKRDYNSHMHHEHSPVKLYCCNYCGKEFEFFTQLYQHFGKHNLLNETKHHCTFGGCKKSFNDKSDLLLHNIWHNTEGEPLFACETCGKVLPTNRTLPERPKCCNISEKPYKCHMCPKAFTQSITLAKHIAQETKSNSKIIKFDCPLCGLVKNYRSELIKHIREHGRVEQKRCQHCEKMFCTVALLSKHIVAEHKGRNSHICEYCYRHFKSKHMLRKHMFDKHSNKTYQCKECGLKYLSPKPLFFHIKNHHKKKTIKKEKKDTYVPRLSSLRAYSDVVEVKKEESTVS